MRTRDQNAIGFIPSRRTCRDAAPRPVATFEPGHTAKTQGDDLDIYSSENEHVASFHGGRHGATDDDNGLHVFRMRAATQTPGVQSHSPT